MKFLIQKLHFCVRPRGPTVGGLLSRQYRILVCLGMLGGCTCATVRGEGLSSTTVAPAVAPTARLRRETHHLLRPLRMCAGEDGALKPDVKNLKKNVGFKVVDSLIISVLKNCICVSGIGWVASGGPILRQYRVWGRPGLPGRRKCATVVKEGLLQRRAGWRAGSSFWTRPANRLTVVPPPLTGAQVEQQLFNFAGPRLNNCYSALQDKS